MQHLDGTSETIATTHCLWIAGVWNPIPLFFIKIVFAREDIRLDSGHYPLVELQMRQFAAE
jgi:hypothetical protein